MNIKSLTWKQVRNDERQFTRWIAYLPVYSPGSTRPKHFKVGYISKLDVSNLFHVMPEVFTQNIQRACESQTTAKLTLDEAMVEFFTSIQKTVDIIFEPDVIEHNDQPTNQRNQRLMI